MVEQRPLRTTAQRSVSLLRLDGNETQLTRAMGVLIADNRELRRVVVMGLLGCAGRPADVPVDLSFRSETAAVRQRRFRSRRLGRVDWRFTAPDFELIVEVKIDAAPGPKQFERYLRDDRVRTASSGGVMALTKHPLAPAELPEQVRGDPKWLGQARWHSFLPEVLRHSPARGDSVDGEVWDALLRYAADPADLGSGLPGWDEIAQAGPGAAISVKRAEILRAAAKEVAAAKAGETDLTPRKRADTVLFEVGLERIRAIELRLDGLDELQLLVAFWPPQPPRRRRSWDMAVRRLIDAGWTLEKGHVRTAAVTLPRGDLPPHLAVADAALECLRPLQTELLPRYRSVMVGRAATAEELEAALR